MTEPAIARPACPRCGARGRVVPAVTPRSLLRAAARARLGDQPLHFCAQPGCPIVYFDADSACFTVADVRVVVFQKSTDPARPVCYCFDHTVAAITADVRGTGTSDVPDQIAAACRAGLDECDVSNPQGRCCLGNVRAVMRAARTSPADGADAPSAGHSCCAAPRSDSGKL